MTVAKDLHLLYDVCLQYAESVARDISDGEHDCLTMCFWNICNRVKISEEIMTFYERSWGSDKFPDVTDELENELVSRVITVTSDLFVDAVSIIEKCMKQSLALYPGSGLKEAALKKSSHLYLRNLAECSLESGIISKSDFEEWDGLLVMRNLVAHNNSISDRSKKYTVKGVTVSMRPGRMMKGPLNTFLVLSSRIIELFYDWIKEIDRRY